MEADLGTIVNNEVQHSLGIHEQAGGLALGMVILGLAFALALYYFRALDPAEAGEHFTGVHRFLRHKWYFDELYSAVIVRPALAVARWCSNIDAFGIDRAVNAVARANVAVARGSGRFDRGVIDGAVNLLADVSYGVGNWLRTVQTGYLRSYVLFLVLAAVGLWMLLTFLIGGTPAAVGAQ